MTTITLTLGLIGLYWTLLYRGVSLRSFSTVTGAVLLGLYGVGAYGATGLGIAAAIFVPLAVILNFTDLRQKLLTRGIFTLFRKTLPEMNSTEREALEAGDVWWEAEMFSGKPDWDTLLSFEYTKLTDEERSFLENETEELCSMLDDWDINHVRKDLPPEAWQFIRDKGFMGMLISKEHGGLGFSGYGQSCIVTKIASRSVTAAVTVMVPNSLGPGELLMHYGTKAQQRKYLKNLADGVEIPCFALTGPEAGSDATKIPDTGVVEKRIVDGKAVLGIRLNFDKRWITLAPVATLIGLAFKLRDPDGLLGDPETVDYGISCALIERGTEGLEIGRRHYPGGVFMNGPVRGKDVFVPVDAIIGGPEMAGKGWRMLVECLSAGRGISLPAMATATGKGMYATTAAYAKVRRQFGLPIGKFEGVQEALGRIGGNTYRLEACRNLTASAVDHCSPSVVTAMMKYHMTESMREILIDAMDIHGGRGVQMGPRNYLALPYQALPVAITVEGANIMTRNLIVFGQGAIRCHPYVFPEMEAGRNPDFEAGLKDFDHLFFSHLGHIFNRGARAFTLALSNRFGGSPVQGEMAGYYRELNRYSAAMAFASDVAMGTLGGSLKLRERTSARLGDVLSHLYMASAVLRYYQENGTTEADLSHARWALEDSLAKIDEAFAEFCRNYPMPVIGKFIRALVQPTGRRHHGPDDELNAAVCRDMMKLTGEGSLVERLSYDAYIGNDPVGSDQIIATARKLAEIEPQYEALLKSVKRGEIAGDSIEEQLQQAVAAGLFDQASADTIRDYEAMRVEAIQTDDFDPEYVVNPQQVSEADSEQPTLTAVAS